jgi:hypothetical protein
MLERLVDTAPDVSLSRFGKQSFHEIQPIATRSVKMGMITGVPPQPSSHFINRADSLVAYHQVVLKTCGRFALMSWRSRGNS